MGKAIDFDDVADIYDYYVNTTLDFNFFQEQFKNTEGPVLELMCGTGRVSLPLLEHGIKLTCVDYCGEMLDVFQEKLKQKGLDAELIQADVRYLDLGRKFNAIFIPFNSFMELIGEMDQIAALKRIHQHLNDKGIFVCTLHNPSLRTQLATGEKVLRGEFALPGNKKLVLHSIEKQDQVNHLIKGTQFFEIYSEQGELELERRLDIKFSLIEQDIFEKMIENTGFTVMGLYGDYNMGDFNDETSPFMIYRLEKGPDNKAM
ncbi:MAG: class I SAM-dependent DNA methyltransferase [Chitinophagales bacterium]